MPVAALCERVDREAFADCGSCGHPWGLHVVGSGLPAHRSCLTYCRCPGYAVPTGAVEPVGNVSGVLVVAARGLLRARAAAGGSEDGRTAMIARVILTLDLTDTQLAAARRRAALLDALNLGSHDLEESYSPSLALARILASDENVVAQLIPAYTEGYTAEPEEPPPATRFTADERAAFPGLPEEPSDG